nr:hypothetical protein [uncultured Roseococcus sp.]
MSRTDHHSRRWGCDHRLADKPDRRPYGGGRKGEAPGWFLHLFEERPSRHHDRRLLRQIVKGEMDADEAIFRRTETENRTSGMWNGRCA